jgi:hypothetical protein
VNAVYTAILKHLRGHEQRPASELAFSEETRQGDIRDLSDTSIPSGPDWRHVVDDYKKKNAHVSLIRPHFDLGVPYSIVTWAELRKRMQDAGYLDPSEPRSNAPGWKVFSQLPGGRLITLSAVGFNTDRTRAMVTVQYDCFPPSEPLTESMCHEGGIYFMEKKDGKWTVGGGGRYWIA